MTESLLVSGPPEHLSIDVRDRFLQGAQIFREAADSALPKSLEKAAGVIADAFEDGRKLLVFGNGGSASDAQHMCGELVVRFQMNRRPLPAIALCCDAAVVTACANDFEYDLIFERQINALGSRGDVALGISTSGRSANVLRGLLAARSKGLLTILMTGSQGGMAGLCDILLAAPGSNTARIQEIHVAAYHAICELVEYHLFGRTA